MTISSVETMMIRNYPLKVGFLASGNGSAMRAANQAVKTGRLRGVDICALLTNREASGALGYAQQHGIPSFIVNERQFGDRTDREIMSALLSAGAHIVFLSGYLRKLGPLTLERFSGRVLNVHPALLPAFGGKGMYGDNVHRAVLASGEAVSGATVHLVDEEYDSGPIISKMSVPLSPYLTIEELRAKVNDVEAELVVHVLSRLAGHNSDIAGTEDTSIFLRMSNGRY